MAPREPGCRMKAIATPTRAGSSTLGSPSAPVFHYYKEEQRGLSLVLVSMEAGPAVKACALVLVPDTVVAKCRVSAAVSSARASCSLS